MNSMNDSNENLTNYCYNTSLSLYQKILNLGEPQDTITRNDMYNNLVRLCQDFYKNVAEGNFNQYITALIKDFVNQITTMHHDNIKFGYLCYNLELPRLEQLIITIEEICRYFIRKYIRVQIPNISPDQFLGRQIRSYIAAIKSARYNFEKLSIIEYLFYSISDTFNCDWLSTENLHSEQIKKNICFQLPEIYKFNYNKLNNTDISAGLSKIVNDMENILSFKLHRCDDLCKHHDTFSEHTVNPSMQINPIRIIPTKVVFHIHDIDFSFYPTNFDDIRVFDKYYIFNKIKHIDEISSLEYYRQFAVDFVKNRDAFIEHILKPVWTAYQDKNNYTDILTKKLNNVVSVEKIYILELLRLFYNVVDSEKFDNIIFASTLTQFIKLFQQKLSSVPFR